MAWLQLRLPTRHPEFAEEVLLAQGAHSVTLLDAADEPILEPGPGETPLWSEAVAVGLFSADADLESVEQALRQLVPDADGALIQRETVDDQDWVRVCLKDAMPMAFGKRLWVCPREQQVDAADAVVVKLDPGLAFGTGTHPTTALCLEWLDAHPPENLRVLDFGCGSGILAIAALKLGAADAVGVDIDPQAMIAAQSNAEENGVGARLALALPQEHREGQFALILANILAGPLIALAPQLKRQLKPGGHIVLSGLLQRQVDEVTAAYAPDIELHPSAPRDDWVCLSGRRPD